MRYSEVNSMAVGRHKAATGNGPCALVQNTLSMHSVCRRVPNDV